MPAYPIEVLNFGQPSFSRHRPVIAALTSLQDDFTFTLPRHEHIDWASPLEYDQYKTDYIWNKLESYRQEIRGFHPFLIVIVHGLLSSDKLRNLFGSVEPERGLAVFSTHDWEKRFAPPPLDAYLAYYLVRYTLSFVCPEVTAHIETRGCFWDKKLKKHEIKESMVAGKICDECRTRFETKVNSHTYNSILSLVTYIRAQAVKKKTQQSSTAPAKRPRVFIGSSKEGHGTAELIQLGLFRDADCSIWSQGVFGLTTGTLESLVAAAETFDYAILILTPDDVTYKRKKKGNAPRDNVLFELGLFMGSLGRQGTFMIICEDDQLALPSDLAGVTAVTFKKHGGVINEAALGPAVTQLKKVMGLIRAQS